MIVCTDPQGVRQVLSDPGFAKGPDYTDFFAIPFGQGLVTSVGQKHKVDRSRFATYFSKQNVGEYVSIMNKHVLRAMDVMIGQGVKEEPFNCEEFFARLTLRVFGEFCLHHDFSTDLELEKKICEVVSKGSYQIGQCITVGLPMLSFTPWYKLVMHTRNTIVKACWPVLEERRQAIAKGEDVPTDPLTAMVRDNLSDEDIADHLVTLVCAGHDTTAFFSAYTTLLLAQNPKVQEKLREEIEQVVGDREEITLDDIDKMGYLRKVMQESLRIYPVIPAVSRTALKDMHVEGRLIPKGVTVLMPVVAMHRNPEIWNEPLEFRPERYVSPCNCRLCCFACPVLLTGLLWDFLSSLSTDGRTAPLS
jgi:cytochrome P450